MKPTYRVIILDDEPPARDLIETFVSQLPDLQCVASCSNAIQGLQAIQDLKPDLLFLDIQMPEMTGLDLMKLPLTPRPEIILTTAYPQYALTSYEFSVLDYLVKPIAFDRFIRAIVKFREKRQPASPPVGWYPIEESPASGQPRTDGVPLPESNSIWLREEKRLLQIPYQEILYVEGLKDYVKVHLQHQVIVTHMNLGKAEKLFAPPQFVRVHRSFIVLLSAIRLIDGNTITLTNGKQLAMGPLYREELKKHISVLL
ncbi:LytR/AlgR family response regulator transcription factor [Spirosoma linguale]|uniref:Two component transcriptional regulator, LytTR family n=1 Tax=Spirosoma linguale (strain ATCC 33905 / DSM 74 / LMG 10896 / Claus 1) TaxID=504472 RepID=D2QDN3_SPILD|nr:two component transcriptional regulator, LytTR family [Spirosoma linguale DSM 74]